MDQDISNPPAISEADKCVMCGLCLPQCPTYQLSLDENESPRGRISLARALLNGDLAANETMMAHLDHCLLCRRCERICPSGVKYGKLIDTVRAQYAQPTELLFDPADRHALRRLNRQAWLAQRTGLLWLLRHLDTPVSKRLRRQVNMLPHVEHYRDWQSHYPASGTSTQGTVQLFTGCVTDALQQSSLQAATRLLQACGFDVEVPATQSCCGALALHSGDTTTAAQLASNNLAAFDHSLPILGIASGCCVTLREYAQPGAGQFTAQVNEICDFLAGHANRLKLQPLARHIAIYTPCSQRNVLRNEQAVPDLLARIPSAQVTQLPNVTACCGAAGNYVLDFPEQADAIRAPLIEAVASMDASQRPDIIVTTNIGCAMHLQAGLREAGLDIPVQHPVDLLAAQLPG